MESIGVSQAKAHVSQLLERVAKGETIIITKRGVPVARLIPSPCDKERRARAAAEELRELRKGHTLDGITIRELIEEGRRF